MSVIPLTRTQYYCKLILEGSGKFLSEKEVREKYGRKSSLSFDLNVLVKSELAISKQEGRKKYYRIKDTKFHK